MPLQEPERVEPGEVAPGGGGPPPPPEHVAGVGLSVGDAVPSLEDLLAGLVVAERVPRGGVGHPLADGVVAGLGLGGLTERGEGARRGGQVVQEEQQGQQDEECWEEDAAPPQARGRAPRRRHGSPARWSSAG